MKIHRKEIKDKTGRVLEFPTEAMADAFMRHSSLDVLGRYHWTGDFGNFCADWQAAQAVLGQYTIKQMVRHRTGYSFTLVIGRYAGWKFRFNRNATARPSVYILLGWLAVSVWCQDLEADVLQPLYTSLFDIAGSPLETSARQHEAT